MKKSIIYFFTMIIIMFLVVNRPAEEFVSIVVVNGLLIGIFYIIGILEEISSKIKE